MPKIRPTSPAVRQAYRRQLPSRKKREAFDQLAELIKTPQDDLGWHHDVGLLVQELERGQQRGTAWCRRLAEALGPSAELLAKTLRFVELYPTREDVRELEDIGASWTQVYRAFAVAEEKRQDFLRQAVDEGWSDERLRVEVRDRRSPKRRGAGGRPLKKPVAYGPEATLRELIRRANHWRSFHEHAWSGVKPAAWDKLGRGAGREAREGLRDLADKACEAVRAVRDGCREVLGPLRRLRGRLR